MIQRRRWFLRYGGIEPLVCLFQDSTAQLFAEVNSFENFVPTAKLP